MLDGIIIAVLAVILFLAVKKSIPHFKGQGGCCAGGGSDVLVKPSKLNKVISTRVVRIDGMHCEHCYARVHNVLNSMDGVNAKVNGRKGLAVLKLEKDIDNKTIKQAVSGLGYTVSSIEEKKG